MESKGTIRLFLDDDPKPVGEFRSPVTFDLDTRLLSDGKHVLKILSKDAGGREGVRLLPFVVRNGPAIDVDGLKANETVDGVIPIMINAYGKGAQDKFIIYGSESPRGIPSWVIILIILFVGWAMHYLVSYLYMKPSG
ncbi:MAG: cytochrome C [Lacunisphaera sp.]